MGQDKNDINADAQSAERAAKLRAQKREAELRMRKVQERLGKITKQPADKD